MLNTKQPETAMITENKAEIPMLGNRIRGEMKPQIPVSENSSNPFD